MPTDDEVNLDNDQSNKAWFDDYADEEQEDFQIDEYDLTATPNDFTF